MDTCSHCGGPLPADATFCPSCGRRTDAPPPAHRTVPIDVSRAQPRYFGLAPPSAVLAASLVLIVVGVVLIATGAPIAGTVAIVVALLLLPAFLAGARRWPDTGLARAGVSAADRVRDEAGAAVESVATWSRASRDVARLRKEQFVLRRERDTKIRELGVSFYAEDGRAAELKAEAQRLDEQIASNERRLQRTVAGARRRVRKSRAAVVATEVIRPADAPEQEPAAADEPLSRAQDEPQQQPSARRRQTRSR